MANLTIQKVTKTGLDPDLVACGVVDEALNNGKLFLYIFNNWSVEHEVKITSPQLCDQGYAHDTEVAIPAAGYRMIGPFDPGRFNNTDRKIDITYPSAEPEAAPAGLAIAAIEVK